MYNLDEGYLNQDRKPWNLTGNKTVHYVKKYNFSMARDTKKVKKE